MADENKASGTEKKKKFRKIAIAALAVLVAAGACAGGYMLYSASYYFKTENASVKADTIVITPLIAGTLLTWDVKEGDTVSKNQTLGRQDTNSVIKSPVDGQVVKSYAVPGETVAPGMEIAIVADMREVYIMANVEETSIFKIKQGQQVDISIDAYPRKKFTGYVKAVGFAAQSAFSTMPSLNTSGTYSKTTQLIPVKISLVNEENLPLLLGMNATVKIHIKGNTAGAASAVTVITAEAGRKTLETSIEISGVLAPLESVSISSKISGRAGSADFEVGETVSKGQLLVQLDTTEIKTQLAAAQASYNSVVDQVKQARIPMDSANSELERTRSLFAEGAATQFQLDQAQAAYDSAKARYDAANTSGLAQARAAVDGAAEQLSNAAIESPIDGVVVTKNIRAGEMVSPGVTLASVSDMSSLKLKGTVPEELLPYLKIGQSVEITLEAFPGALYKGEISLLEPLSVGAGSYFPIELTIENTGGITAGLSAHSLIQVKETPGITVPKAAVVKDGAESLVFVIDGGIAHKRLVTTGFGNSDEIEITSGLSAGEKVAVNNAAALTDGMAVTAMD